MRSTKVNRNDRLRTTGAVESSSWWPFLAIVLGALGCYGLLVVHLILDATNAGAWGLAWMGVPMVFLAGSVGAVLIASGMPARERLAAISAASFGYSPRKHSRLPSTPPTREPA
jgi:hypothetical protein